MILPTFPTRARRGTAVCASPLLAVLLVLTASLLLPPPAAYAQGAAPRHAGPPSSGPPAGQLATGSAPPDLRSVDANTASEEHLRSIPGIGPATAQRIIQTRQRKPFRDLRDFAERVPGIGPKRLQQFSDAGLVVRRTAPLSAPAGAPAHAAAPGKAPPGTAAAPEPPPPLQDVQLIEGGIREGPYRDQVARARK